MLSINNDQIEKIGRCISTLELKESYMNRPFITFDASNAFKSNAYIFASAICHQTHALRNETKNLIGWNYIEYVFTKLAETESKLLDLSYINSLSSEELADNLKRQFPLNDDNNLSSLDKAVERADLMKNIAAIILEHGCSNSLEFLNAITTNSTQSINKLYDSLSKMSAFSDPFRKKSTLFIKLLNQSGVVSFSDLSQIQPLMDYHMQRLLLRTGCVKILDEKLAKKLKKRESLESDTEVREACIEAIKRISDVSGKSVLDLDDLFWAIGRSCCNKAILCDSGKCDKSPCTLTTIAEITNHNKCVLQDGCEGYLRNELRQYWEPAVNTDYY